MSSSLLMILLLIVLMYFMMIRPQRKAQQKQKDMLSNLKPGTEVITIGGLHATIDSVSEDRKTVSLDADGSYLTYETSAIRTVVPAKTEATVEEADQEVKAEATETVDEAQQVDHLLSNVEDDAAKAEEKSDNEK